MSPTVLRESGYQFVIYSNEHEPAHVHVYKGDDVARIQLEPVQVLNNWGYNTREISKILSIVGEHQEFLIAAWQRLQRR